MLGARVRCWVVSVMAISVCKLPALQFHSLATKSSAESSCVIATRFAAKVNLGFSTSSAAAVSHCVGTSYGKRSYTTCAASTPAAAPKTSSDAKELDDRVVQINTVEEFDAAIKDAKRKLVVVEYAASHSKNSRTIYPAMVELSRTSQNAVFLLVMGDENEETKEICKRAGIEKVCTSCQFSLENEAIRWKLDHLSFPVDENSIL